LLTKFAAGRLIALGAFINFSRMGNASTLFIAKEIGVYLQALMAHQA